MEALNADGSNYLDAIIELAETEPLEAAMELGRGLMRGNASQFKQGYSANAAASAAQNLIKLDDVDAIALITHLRGFAYGMREDSDEVLPA